MRTSKEISWFPIIFLIFILIIALVSCHADAERKRFGDGTCQVCGVGQYKLFDIEHTRFGDDLYYYRCDKYGYLERYENYQGG